MASPVWSCLAVIVVLSGLTGPVTALGDGANEESRTPQPPTPEPPGSDWQSVTNDTDGDRPTVQDRGEGHYRIHVSTGDPRMVVDLDVSLLGAPFDPGTLGVSALGTIRGERVVSVVAGVRSAGVEDVGTFLQQPFEGFTVVSRTTLSLPFPTTTSAITNASEPATVPVDPGSHDGNASDASTGQRRGDSG
jgi:hypothetical protein